MSSIRKFLLWFLAALQMTACGGCSAIDDKADGDEVIDADSLVVGDRLPEFEENLAEDIEPFWKFAELTMPYSPQPDRKVYSRFAPSRREQHIPTLGLKYSHVGTKIFPRWD